MPEGFVANDAWFAELGKSPGVVSLCKTAADATASRARGRAPVLTGEYRDKIHVERHDTQYRCVFRVVAGAAHSLGVESKTGNLARSLGGGGARA
ncbi:HK97 gp10 family phage protein [Microbacterium sp. NPDC089696]|uniref:HK97 gp10 family phage protein n=1 Tax=Microbacterium sp. NPDC089696 TaxID=3364199 RepID=UPI00381EC78F